MAAFLEIRYGFPFLSDLFFPVESSFSNENLARSWLVSNRATRDRIEPKGKQTSSEQTEVSAGLRVEQLGWQTRMVWPLTKTSFPDHIGIRDSCNLIYRESTDIRGTIRNRRNVREKLRRRGTSRRTRTSTVYTSVRVRINLMNRDVCTRVYVHLLPIHSNGIDGTIDRDHNRRRTRKRLFKYLWLPAPARIPPVF